MKKIKVFIAIFLAFMGYLAHTQVITNFNNETKIPAQGRFVKEYKPQIDFEIPAKIINGLLEAEMKNQLQTNEARPFKLAVPVSIDLDIAKYINWTYDKDFAYGKFTIKLNGALSASINFSQFYLPNETEMYV